MRTDPLGPAVARHPGHRPAALLPARAFGDAGLAALEGGWLDRDRDPLTRSQGGSPMREISRRRRQDVSVGGSPGHQAPSSYRVATMAGSSPALEARRGGNTLGCCRSTSGIEPEHFRHRVGLRRPRRIRRRHTRSRGTGEPRSRRERTRCARRSCIRLGTGRQGAGARPLVKLVSASETNVGHLGDEHIGRTSTVA